MRFCPFCAKENTDEANLCAFCGKKLPQRRLSRPPAKTEVQPPSALPAHRAATAAPAKTLSGVGALKAPPPLAPGGPTAAPEPPRPRETPAKLLDPEGADGKTNPVPKSSPPPAPVVPADTVQTARVEPDQVIESGPTEIGAPAVEAFDTTRSPKIEPPAPSSSVILDDDGPSPLPEVPALVPSRAVLVAPPSYGPPGLTTMGGVDLSSLPPMPGAPSSPGVVGALTYLLPVARAWWSRRGAIARVRGALVDDQRALDQVLGELGRAARDDQSVAQVPALRDEMAQLAAGEERRARAEAESLAASDRRAAEVERFGQLQADHQARIVEQDENVRVADERLRVQADKRREEQAELARVESELRQLERKAAALEARAAKLLDGDPQKAPTAAEGAAAAARAAELMPQRDAVYGRAQALEAPIAQLTRELADARVELASRKKALAQTLAEKATALAAIDQRIAQLAQEQQTAASEISRRFVTIGTLLNLNRVESLRFSPLYARIDELKGGLTEREMLIARLEDERQAFDHAAMQKGLVILGAGIGGLLVLAVLLILIVR